MTDSRSGKTIGPTTMERPPPTEPVRPQLRLHHLFAATAVTAVLLAISGPRDYQGHGFDVPRLLQLTFIGLGIVLTILAAVAITFVAYGIAWRRQGYAFFHEPGHWLLVAIALSQLLTVIQTAAVWVAATIQRESIDNSFARIPYMMSWLMPGLVMLILNFYIGRKKCYERHWRRVFYGKAAAAVLPGVSDLVVLLFLERAVRAENPRRPSKHWKTPPGYVPPIVTGLGQRRTRDAAHWCGVVIQFALSGFAVAIFVGVFLWIPLSLFSR